MRKIVITTLTAAICVAPFAMSTAVAGDIGGLRQQLHHDQHARHDARAKLDADIRNGNTAAIAGGTDFIRVHDVAQAVQGARMADALYRYNR